MKRVVFMMLIGLWAACLYGQDHKPCGTSVLARRHLGRDIVREARAVQKNSSPDVVFQGEKRGLIILVSFPNQPFNDDDPKALWTAIANQKGLDDHKDLVFQGARGSVSDYFYDQSYGQFKLTFDVVGPVEAKKPYEYYGRNIDWGPPSGEFDQNDGELVEEACRAVNDSVHFADYDWDGDGEVEQVFILYAGHGENDYWSKDESVIWPHMGSLTVDWGYKEPVLLQGLRIDTYACSNEINHKNKPAGMGTICHEFGHCLGLPDLYNTEEGSSVVGTYDIMDGGCYNGNCWCPAGYSSYERYACGWLTPQEVQDAHTVESLEPLYKQPDVRIYRTSPEANDYYLIEYREKASWDTYLPMGGLMAWHIDYDKTAWEMNTVNNDPDHLRVERMPLAKVPVGILPVSADVSDPDGWYDLQGRRLPGKPSEKGLYIHNGKIESIR